MASWQRRARFVFAVVAVAVVVTVALALKRRTPQATVAAPSRTDPTAVIESRGGRVERFRLSREDVRVEYESQLTYADGSTRMQGLRIVTDERGGRSFTATGRRGQVKDNESNIALDGDVQITASDGLVVKTEAATYNNTDGVVRAPGVVHFTRGRLTGSGHGMSWDRERDVMTMLERAVVDVAPAADGAGAAHITSATAALARRDHTLRFEGGARIQRDAQTTEATTAVARLSSDDKRVESIELRDKSRISIARAAVGALQSLSGKDIDVRYRADGETLEHATVVGNAAIVVAGERGISGRQITAARIEIDMAPDGATPTAVVARDAVQLTIPAQGQTPQRVVRSTEMNAKGEAGRGLTRAYFTGNVQYRERGGTIDRSVSAAGLDVALKPGLGGLDEALFAGTVKFADGPMTALAQAARYDLEKGTLELSGSEPGIPVPHVANDHIALDSTAVNVVLEGPRMKAQGNVKSVLHPARKSDSGPTSPASPRLPAMLKQGEPVNIVGSALDYDGAASRAVYTGAALLWQGDTSVKGQSIALDEKSGDLAADGAVTTTTMLEEVDKNKVKKRVRSIGTSKTFRYDEATRRATYAGDAHLTGSQGDMTATTIELYLKPGGNELERAEAYESVVLRDQNRKTTGKRLTYTTADERYLVTGTPVTILDECARETVGRTLTYLRTADTIVVDGNEQTRTQTKGTSTCTDKPRP